MSWAHFSFRGSPRFWQSQVYKVLNRHGDAQRGEPAGGAERCPELRTVSLGTTTSAQHILPDTLACFSCIKLTTSARARRGGGHVPCRTLQHVDLAKNLRLAGSKVVEGLRLQRRCGIGVCGAMVRIMAPCEVDREQGVRGRRRRVVPRGLAAAHSSPNSANWTPPPGNRLSESGRLLVLMMMESPIHDVDTSMARSTARSLREADQPRLSLSCTPCRLPNLQ
mmetsp:Transcript_48285/g.96668  ORF Transcript_48285/g.96668 Transcript_48285/m.96668 type:complete len:223 (+) Transcript_48285:447-1115(+)